MKHLFVILFSLLTLIANKSGCHTNKNNNNCFKGILVVKGACLNYAVSVTEGDMSKLQVQDWTDPQTNKQYRNAFAISNPCGFPDSIKEGDTFSFTLTDTATDCARCLLYRELPDKKHNIVIQNGGCK